MVLLSIISLCLYFYWVIPAIIGAYFGGQLSESVFNNVQGRIVWSTLIYFIASGFLTFIFRQTNGIDLVIWLEVLAGAIGIVAEEFLRLRHGYYPRKTK